MSLRDFMQSCTEEVEQRLRHAFDELEIPPSLRKAMDYSLLAGGKRLRPLLCIASCEAVGGECSDAISAAVAFELIHTYSLIHDDLPAMDDDDLRRGRPTNHRVFGEAMAILAGDGLLTHAFSLLSSQGERWSSEVGLAVTRELALAAGPQGMVGGQVLDLEAEQDGAEDLVQLERVHHLKTGALIRGAIRSGALIGRATQAQLEALTLFGEHLGLAFQMMDDLLDRTGDEILLGKPIGSDQRQGKQTVVDFLGIEGTHTAVQKQTESALQALQKAELNSGILADMARFLRTRRM